MKKTGNLLLRIQVTEFHQQLEQTERKAPENNAGCQHLDFHLVRAALDFQPPEVEEKNVFSFKPLNLWLLTMATKRKWTQSIIIFEQKVKASYIFGEKWDLGVPRVFWQWCCWFIQDLHTTKTQSLFLIRSCDYGFFLLIIKCKIVHLAHFIFIILDLVYCSSLSRYFGVWILSSKYSAMPSQLWVTSTSDQSYRRACLKGCFCHSGSMLFFSTIALLLGLPLFIESLHVYQGAAQVPQLSRGLAW